MISADEDALICDFAEVYRVYDYKSLPLKTAAAFFMGLKQDSRCKMAAAGQKFTLTEMLAVMIYDKLAWLKWAKTKDGANGRNMPQPLAAKLFAENKDKNDIEGFYTAEDFEKERRKLLGGEG